MKKTLVILILAIFAVGTCFGLTARLSLEDIQTAAGMVTSGDPYGIQRIMLETECIGKILSGYSPKYTSNFRIIYEENVTTSDIVMGAWGYTIEDASELEEISKLDGETTRYTFRITEDFERFVESKNQFYYTWFSHDGNENFFNRTLDYMRLCVGVIILVVETLVDTALTVIPYIVGFVRAVFYLVGL